MCTTGCEVIAEVAVVGVMNKKSGKVRTFIAHKINGDYVRELVESLIKSGSSIHTDKAIFYWKLKNIGYRHKMIDDSKKEYVSKKGVTTNFIQSF